MTIRALIVDDEPLGRERIRTLLRDAADVEVVGECAGGREAVAAVLAREPDLLFLDVQMPELDGFGVLDALPPGAIPVVVFVTAYDRYALRAFEVHAQDYLLKPFDQERFLKALQRARQAIRRERGGEATARLLALLEEMRGAGSAAAPRRHLERLAVKSAGRIYFLAADEIDWVEAADNYVRLHARGDVHVVRETMSRLEADLDPARFVRIHRSTIVNVARIREMQPWFNGEYVVLLRDGTRLVSSRSCRARIEELLSPGR